MYNIYATEILLAGNWVRTCGGNEASWTETRSLIHVAIKVISVKTIS